MSAGKSYLLFEMMKQLKEKNQIYFHEIEKGLQQKFSQEPRYLLIPGGGIVDIHTQKKDLLMLKAEMKRKNRRFLSLFFF